MSMTGMRMAPRRKMKDRILSLLSIAARGGNVKSGEYQTEESVKKGRSRLVIVAGDASGNTRKKFGNMTEYYGVPFRLYSTAEELGHATGREARSSLSITEDGFARKLMALLDDTEKAETTVRPSEERADRSR